MGSAGGCDRLRQAPGYIQGAWKVSKEKDRGNAVVESCKAIMETRGYSVAGTVRAARISCYAPWLSSLSAPVLVLVETAVRHSLVCLRVKSTIMRSCVARVRPRARAVDEIDRDEHGETDRPERESHQRSRGRERTELARGSERAIDRRKLLINRARATRAQATEGDRPLPGRIGPNWDSPPD